MIGHARALLVALLACVTAAVVVPGVAVATPPLNDDFDSATVVTSLPHFTYNLDTREATAAPDDPTACANEASVWFSVTPDQSGLLTVDIEYATYGPVVSVYTGSRGALAPVTEGCPTGTRAVTVEADVTYHVMVARCCGTGGGGYVDVGLTLATVAANDSFATATAVSALPFETAVDTLGLTREPGEPVSSCGSGGGGTAWFSYTATESRSLRAGMYNAFSAVTAVYTGTSLADLDEVACGRFSGAVVFPVVAGTTYHLQVGEYYSDEGGRRTFTMGVAPQPTAGFAYSPSSPSRYDTLSFFETAYDPAGGRFVSFDWDFGDGATGTGVGPDHRYAADGTYPVRLTVTTADGRTATVTRDVEVRTHDVGIAAFTVPTRARVGQSRPITVEVRNAAYPEVVTVELYRSDPDEYDGFVRFGQLTQTVPAEPGRTVAFPFAYTFTDEDAMIGRVTFKAVAVLADGTRDALSADNTVIAVATRVGAAGAV